MREWPHGAVGFDIGIHNNAVIFDGYIVSEARVGDACARAYLAVFADNGFSFEVNVRIDYRIATNLSRGTHISVRRIDERHAALQHERANRIPAQQVLEFSQLCARVYA